MCTLGRRDLLILLGCAIAAPASASPAEESIAFAAAAFRMRALAVAGGDQAYGAVVVRNGGIVGYGPSRVVADADADAHAERVAIKDAQRRLGTTDLSGAVLYSTSRPCSACETAAAAVNIERMHFGRQATDAGRPRSAAQPR